MTARLLAFVIWAAVAATVVFWGLRLLVTAPSAPAHATTAATTTQPRGDLTRLFGGPPVAAKAPAPAVSSRFKLVGVVAPRSAADSTGVALIAVDEKPARAFRVGTAVDEQWVVKAVHTRSASLGPRDGETALQLELPPLPTAATGTLPATPSLRAAAPAPTMPPPVQAPPPATPVTPPVAAPATPVQPPPTQAPLPAVPAPAMPGASPAQPVPQVQAPLPQPQVQPLQIPPRSVPPPAQ